MVAAHLKKHFPEDRFMGGGLSPHNINDDNDDNDDNT